MAPADDLTYSFTTPDDHDEVLHFFVQQFITREPMRLTMGQTWDDHREWVMPIFDEAFSCEASVIARDPAKGNKVVGIRLSNLAGREGGRTFSEAVEKSTGKVRVLLDILCKVQEGCDLFEDEAVDKILEHVFLCVADGYSGRGISYRMCEMSEKRGKEMDAQYARVQATNVKSQRIFRKMGFEVRGSIDYATYEVDGEKIFDTTLMRDSTCLQDMIKKL